VIPFGPALIAAANSVCYTPSVAVRTIFSMAEDCARGERLGWQEFVRDYGSIARTLLTHYFPMLAPEIDAHIAAVFQRARAGDNAWFQQFKFQNEREFLMAFRELVFAYGREVARLPVPELSLDQVRSIMKDLPVVEREVLWIVIKGYPAARIGAIMMNSAATAQAVKDIADQRLAAVLPGATADAFNISARVLMAEAEKTGGEACLPLRTFNNLVNGQVSWRERELAEQHIRDCFRCLDRYTAFLEMIRLRKDAQPLTEQEINPIISQLNLPAEKGRGLLAKLFAK
jgi:hypothetical protein